METFDLTHYVPILRWKPAEQVALARLYPQDSVNVTPLVEIVPENFVRKVVKAKPPKVVRFSEEDVINRVVGQLLTCWGNRQVYLDPGLVSTDYLASGESHFLTQLGEYASILGVSIVPVTRIRHDDAYQSAVRRVADIHQQGVCLRLVRDDLERPTLTEDIRAMLRTLQISQQGLDLIVDLDVVDQDTHELEQYCELVPNVLDWRNFMVASGAFPEDLRHLPKNDVHDLPRTDWTSWKCLVTGARSLRRCPVYADYTIQHALYRDRVGQTLNYSASIRYTADENWVIMRGESVTSQSGPGPAQWAANALLLSQRPEYCGSHYSYSDRYIKEKSGAYGNPGTAKTWLLAGVNHHLTFVVRQLSKLFGTSTAALS